MIYRTSKNERGFTLVEVLIALFIFSLISVGATSALTSSLRGQAQMEERLGEVSNLENMRALMRSDMASLTLRERREPYGNVEPYVLQSGGEVLLDFTRTGRSNPIGEPRGDLQRAAYIFNGDQLIRRTYAQINPAPQSGYVDRILVEKVADAKMQLVTYNPALSVESYIEGYALQITKAETDRINKAKSALRLLLTFENGDILTQYFELGL